MSAPEKPAPVPATVEVKPRRDEGDVQLVLTVAPEDALDVALRLVGAVRLLRRSP